MSRNKFPDDPDNRIQNLYYDININTIFNRKKLQNIKNKFCKYQNYLNKKYFKHIQPLLLQTYTTPIVRIWLYARFCIL